MSIFKKFAAPLIAVALVAVMGVSLLSVHRTAYAAASVTTTGALATIGGQNTSNGGAIYSVLPSAAGQFAGTQAAFAAIAPTTVPVITMSAASDVTIASTLIFQTSSEYEFGASVCMTIATTVGGTTFVATKDVTDNTKCSVLAATANSAAADILTMSTWSIRPRSNTAAAGTVKLVGGTSAIGVTAATTNLTVMNTTTTARSTTGSITVFPTSATSIDAGGSNLANFTVVALDGGGYPFTNQIMNASAGIGGFGTGGTATASDTTSSTTGGWTSLKYRGKGVTGTDTIVVTGAGLTNVTPGTYAITLVAPSGNTAAKTNIITVGNAATAATITTSTPTYVSTQLGGAVTVSETDAAGAGVNNQLLQFQVNQGSLAAVNFAASGSTATVAANNAAITAAIAACGTGSTTLVTAYTGTIGSDSGRATVVYCPTQTAGAGAVTLTITNLSTTGIPAATQTLTSAGIPSTIAGTATGGIVTVTVKDAKGNAVADGTPVGFTVNSNVGNVASTCVVTSGGTASTAAIFTGTGGTVLATAGWAETGTVAGCTSGAIVNGAKLISTSVAVSGGVVAPPTPAPAAGAGTFVAAPVFSASKLAASVFNGGTVAQLDTAITGGGGTGAWAQDAKGVFALYIVNGGFVNDAFKAAFPTGFAGVTALTVVGK